MIDLSFIPDSEFQRDIRDSLRASPPFRHVTGCVSTRRDGNRILVWSWVADSVWSHPNGQTIAARARVHCNGAERIERVETLDHGTARCYIYRVYVRQS